MKINKFFTTDVTDVLKILEFGGFSKVATDGDANETSVYENGAKEVIIAPISYTSAHIILIDKSTEN